MSNDDRDTADARSGKPRSASPEARYFSSAAFGLVILCFFLPFISFSCSNSKVMNLSGLQAVTGFTYQEPSMFGESKTKRMDGEPLAMAAAGSAVVGLGFSLGSAVNPLPAVAGGAGAACLLLLRAKVDHDVTEKTHGMIGVNYEPGFWGALVMLVLGALLNGYFFVRSRS